MNEKLFHKDFTLVVIGQIISLFGNATIRFALPLYLLNLTGSSALYGTVTACAFLPALLLFPPLARRYPISIFKCPGEMQLVRIPYRVADILDRQTGRFQKLLCLVCLRSLAN